MHIEKKKKEPRGRIFPEEGSLTKRKRIEYGGSMRRGQTEGKLGGDISEEKKTKRELNSEEEEKGFQWGGD